MPPDPVTALARKWCYAPHGEWPCKMCDAITAAVREALKEAEKIVHGYATAYPEDIFIPPPPHEHGRTIDACSARALRAVLPNVERDIAALRGGTT